MTHTFESLSALISQKRGEFKAFYDAIPKGKDIEGQSGPACKPEDIQDFKKRNEELNELVDQYNVLVEAKKFVEGDPIQRQTPANVKESDYSEYKTLGEMLTNSAQYKGASSRSERDNIGGVMVDFNLGRAVKATMTTSSGYTPFVQRTGDVVMAVSRPPQLIDYLTIYPTTQNSLAWMAQTTRTNSSAEAAEAAALAESTFIYTAQTDVLRKIGTFVPVTEEQLEDVPMIEAIINQDLMLAVRQRLDLQITAGNGSGSNLTGIVNRSGIQSQAKGSESVLDALGSGIAKVQLNAYANPNVCVMHVTDIWTLAKLKDVTSGQYLLGDPTNAPQLRAWGLSIVRSEGTSQGTAIVMDTDYFKLAMRKEVEVGVGWQNDDFVKGLRTVRAYCRAGLLALRESAACKVTGL